jgi:pilus assembly protein Flp/PilA
MRTFLRFLENEDGATAIEYGLIGTLISVALIAGFSQLATALNNRFTYLANESLGNGHLGSP